MLVTCNLYMEYIFENLKNEKCKSQNCSHWGGGRQMGYGANTQVAITELVMLYFLQLLLVASVIISLYATYLSYFLNESNITLTNLNEKSLEFSGHSKCYGKDYL